MYIMRKHKDHLLLIEKEFGEERLIAAKPCTARMHRDMSWKCGGHLSFWLINIPDKTLRRAKRVHDFSQEEMQKIVDDLFLEQI